VSDIQRFGVSLVGIGLILIAVGQSPDGGRPHPFAVYVGGWLLGLSLGCGLGRK
jgi:hypothetical protein